VLKSFEVIWVFDRLTKPQKLKMMVCLSWDDGWLLRINTKDKFRPCVAIGKTLNPWLEHDSFVECSLMEWDEFELSESLKNPRNPVGMLHDGHRHQVLQHLLQAPYIRTSDKVRLGQLLN
jgi:hypothetical protein